MAHKHCLCTKRRWGRYEVWVWRKVLNILWSEKIGNEEVLQHMGKGLYSARTIHIRQRAWLEWRARGLRGKTEILNVVKDGGSHERMLHVGLKLHWSGSLE